MSTSFMSSPSMMLTSESVTEGHPDKLCDQVSDAVLDAILSEDANARVACETATTTGTILVFGEITTSAYVDIEKIVRNTVRRIGDTGSAIGFACNETDDYMPLTISLAHALTRRLAELRHNRTLPFLRPDGKAQVTVEYAYGAPRRIEAVVVSTQHAPEVGDDVLHRDIEQLVIRHVCPPELLQDTKFFVNPTGRFVTGGPMGDAGLTGRKIIVDTYGGIARHGGGAFSGKDPSKVDRSAAYAARHLAKNVVAAGLADRFEVQVSYAIGVSRPTSIAFEAFGTAHIDEGDLGLLIHKHFDLRPAAIVDRFQLRRPIYLQTASYGHFGRPDLDLPWERLDQADVLRREAGIAVVHTDRAS